MEVGGARDGHGLRSSIAAFAAHCMWNRRLQRIRRQDRPARRATRALELRHSIDLFDGSAAFHTWPAATFCCGDAAAQLFLMLVASVIGEAVKDEIVAGLRAGVAGHDGFFRLGLGFGRDAGQNGTTKAALPSFSIAFCVVSTKG